MRDSVFLRNPFLKALRDQRRALVGFGIGLVAYAGLIVSFFSTVQAEADRFAQLLDAYPPALKAAFGIESLATGAGFLHAELFSAMLPILFLVYAIGRGSDLLAGEEERGQLELVAATPVTRRALTLQKAASLAAGLALLGLVLFLTILVGNAAFGLGVSAVNLAAAVAALVLLAAACGALAFAVGAATGRRGLAMAVATGVAVLAYLLDVVSRIVESASALKWVSLFHYYGGNEPLVNGPDGVGLAVLLVATLAFFAAALVAFERRDLSR